MSYVDLGKIIYEEISQKKNVDLENVFKTMVAGFANSYYPKENLGLNFLLSNKNVEPYIPNLCLLLCLKPFKKFLVGEWWMG